MIIEKMPIILYVMMQILVVSVLIYYVLWGKLNKDVRILSVSGILISLFCIVAKVFPLNEDVVGIGALILSVAFLSYLIYVVCKKKLMRQILRNKAFIFLLVVLAICFGVVVVIEVFY